MKPILLVLLLPLYGQYNLPATFAGEADWPQWRGPTRNGHSPAKKLLKTWPEKGPKIKWTFADAGIGYSTIAIVDDCVYTLGSNDRSCFALCLNLQNGSIKWKTAVLCQPRFLVDRGSRWTAVRRTAVFGGPRFAMDRGSRWTAVFGGPRFAMDRDSQRTAGGWRDNQSRAPRQVPPLIL